MLLGRVWGRCWGAWAWLLVVGRGVSHGPRSSLKPAPEGTRGPRPGAGCAEKERRKDAFFPGFPIFR